MPKVWNLGNTTLRNPNRIRSGLMLFAAEFNGRLHGDTAERRFAKRLSEENIVQTEGTNPEWFGRKWRSSFVKLGFATDISFAIDGTRLSASEVVGELKGVKLAGTGFELTPSGQMLIEATTTGAQQDSFLRQLVRHEIPSPVEPGPFPPGKMKPFIFVLQVLQQLETLGQPGLDKIETALFIQPFVDHAQKAISRTVQSILEYRQERARINAAIARKRYDRRRLADLQARTGVKLETPIDYADTTFRYSQLTGLVTQSGGRLVLRDNRRAVIDSLLEQEPQFLAQKDPYAYLADFYTGTKLPLDSYVVAQAEIARIANELTRYGMASAGEKARTTKNIKALGRIRHELQQQLSWEREQHFAQDQANPESLNEIAQYLDDLKGNRSKTKAAEDRAAYLEWAVWRGFLAIDRITQKIHATRRFQLDEDLFPMGPAPGGGPDMLFEFQDFILSVEVTLTGGPRQVAVEGEPVRRHIADARAKYGKPVYGLFVAPTIDHNTAQTFADGTWWINEQKTQVDIVPVTLDQFGSMIDALRRTRYDPSQVRILLDKCLQSRSLPAPKWKRTIDTNVTEWLSELA